MKKYCSKCKKCLTSEKDTTMIGMHFMVSGNTEPEEGFIQEQFGKYDYKEEYNFCYECWLDAMFGV